MHMESITFIDEGDIIAFTDDLPFEYEGVHEIKEDEALTIDWVEVHKAQVTGSIIILDVTHLRSGYRIIYRLADFVKVIVED